MAGRRPLPTATKLLRGNPGKRAINQREPKPTGIPTCPTHLDATAKREWTRISRELIDIGLLTEVDRSALAAYCAAYSRWASAEKSIAKFGLVIKSPKSGYPVANPFVGIANTALQIMHRFAIEFGLTPASRTRLQVEPVGGPDAFEQFMNEIGANEPITDDSEPVSTE
jgi:P27 family predicted phage terminase small subunit